MSDKRRSYLTEQIKSDAPVYINVDENGDKDKVTVVNLFPKTLENFLVLLNDTNGNQMPVGGFDSLEPGYGDEIDVDIEKYKSMSKLLAEKGGFYTTYFSDDKDYVDMKDVHMDWTPRLASVIADVVNKKNISVREALPKVEYVENSAGTSRYRQEKYDGFEFRVNEPVRIIRFNDNKRKVLVKSWCLKTIRDVDIVMEEKDGTKLTVYTIDELKPFDKYILEFPYASDDCKWSFVCGDETYQWFQKNIRTHWKLLVQNNMDMSMARNYIMMTTMLGFAVSSKLFECAMDHYDSLTNDNNGVLRQFNVKNLLADENKKKCYYTCIGVDSYRYGGRPWTNGFKVGHGASDKICILGIVGDNYKAGGYTVGNDVNVKRAQIASVSKTHTIDVKMMHEFGHMWGCGHMGIWTHSIMDSKTVRCPTVDGDPYILPEVGNIIAKDCPYYGLYADDKVQCGYTSFDKWVYDNVDKFVGEGEGKYFTEQQAKDYKERLEENRDKRNQNAKAFNAILGRYPWKPEHAIPALALARQVACLAEQSSFCKTCDNSAQQYLELADDKMGYSVKTI